MKRKEKGKVDKKHLRKYKGGSQILLCRPPFTDKIFGKVGISLGNYTKYEPIQYMNL